MTYAAAHVFRRAGARVYRRLGQDAVYTPLTGAPKSVRVVINHDLDAVGQSAPVNARSGALYVQTAELADAPRRGERFTTDGGRVWKVDRSLGGDDFEHIVLVS